MQKIKLNKHPLIEHLVLYNLMEEMTGKTRQALNKALRRRGLDCNSYGVAKYLKEILNIQ